MFNSFNIETLLNRQWFRKNSNICLFISWSRQKSIDIYRSPVICGNSRALFFYDDVPIFILFFLSALAQSTYLLEAFIAFHSNTCSTAYYIYIYQGLGYEHASENSIAMSLWHWINSVFIIARRRHHHCHHHMALTHAIHMKAKYINNWIASHFDPHSHRCHRCHFLFQIYY